MVLRISVNTKPTTIFNIAFFIALIPMILLLCSIVVVLFLKIFFNFDPTNIYSNYLIQIFYLFFIPSIIGIFILMLIKMGILRESETKIVEPILDSEAKSQILKQIKNYDSENHAVLNYLLNHKISQEKGVLWLKKQWKGNKSCPICESNSWIVHPEAVEVNESYNFSQKYGSKKCPMMIVKCSVCGYSLFFDAFIADVFDSNEIYPLNDNEKCNTSPKDQEEQNGNSPT
jgi:hypothetical protein